MQACKPWLKSGALGLLAIAAFACPSAPAENYPARPVTVITPAAAGNSPDVIARIVADRLTQLWQQQVVVINRPGAGGMIAAQAAATAKPDGYTLYMTQSSTYIVLPQTQTKLPFDLARDIVPIGLVGEQPFVFAVPASLGVNTIAELIALAKSRPGGLLFSATNRGGVSHLTGELFRARTGVEFTFVHYPGAAQSVNDLIGGRVALTVIGYAALAGAIQAGSIKALAVTSAKRLPNLPDLPTVAETIAGFQSNGWLALMAPAGTPEAVIAKLSNDLRGVLEQAGIRQRFAVLGTYFERPLSPAETAEYILREQQLWEPIVRQISAAPQ